MLDKICKEIEQHTNVQIILAEPMCKHTSFKIGGIADAFIKATTVEEVQYICEICKQYHLPLTIVGNGTNILVRDKRD